MISTVLKQKLNRLKSILLAHKNVLLAYSGGVDSTFLLRCCCDYLGKNVLAVTAVSPTYTRKELKTAREFARGLRLRHKVISTDEVDNSNFRKNPPERCYYCKRELFLKLRLIARRQGIRVIIDGSNLDDLKDYRPGAKAKKEFGVCSPLSEAGFTKEDIRKLSKEFGLKTWKQAPGACLASRIPYGQKITRDSLLRIEKAEEYLRSLGFKLARLRHYALPDKTLLARIEVDKKEIKKLIRYQSAISRRLKKLGYDYITVDLEGYRTGSMNLAVPKIKDML